MRILVTGGTGFIGRALCLLLHRRGHQVYVATRSSKKAARLPALAGCTLLSYEDEFPEAEVIVNLAGASISAWPLTSKRLELLLNSRLQVLGRLKEKYRDRPFPGLLIQASATSVYRDGLAITEQGALSDTQEGRLSRSVERAARDLCAGRCKLAVVRIGMVIGPQGGIVRVLRLLPPFSILGHQVWMPYLTLRDCVCALSFIASRNLEGVFNLCSPDPLKLNAVLRLAKPGWWGLRLPLPAFLVRLDSRSRLLFFNAQVRPEALLRQGFEFQDRRMAKMPGTQQNL